VVLDEYATCSTPFGIKDKIARPLRRLG